MAHAARLAQGMESWTASGPQRAAIHRSDSAPCSAFGSCWKIPTAKGFAGVMHKMRFTGTEARGKKVTAEYAVLIRAAAREHFGWPSLALAQASSLNARCAKRT
jgi:hypothetical protein